MRENLISGLASAPASCYNTLNKIDPAEDNPRDFWHALFRLHVARRSFEKAPKKQIGEIHHFPVETDRQKEGYPTELWRERETAAYVDITNW